MNSLISKSLTKLPEFLRSSDLIALGLFSSYADVSHAIKRNQAPPHIKIGKRKTVFPKSQLIYWLKFMQHNNKKVYFSRKNKKIEE
jgi:hypothetical protein